MASWATEAEALALTGQTVTLAQLTQAQGVIDVFAGAVVESADNLTVRDRRLLRMATAYQAVWMAAQVDVLSRVDVKRVEQDGAEFEPSGENAMLLAPLAQRCLAQLSWRRARSVRVECGIPRYRNWEAYAAAWMRDEEPDLGWVPL